MKVYILTSDPYLTTLKGTIWTYQKYWAEQEVVICGFTKPDYPLPPKFSFVSLGKQEEYPLHHWTNRVLEMLDRIPEKHFIWSVEDYFLSAPVDRAGLKTVYDYVLPTSNIIRIGLSENNPAVYGYDYVIPKDRLVFSRDGVDLVHMPRESQYYANFQLALWNRDLCRRCFVPNESPWDAEIRSGNRAMAIGNTYHSFKVFHPLIKYGNVCHLNDPYNWIFVNPDDVPTLEAMIGTRLPVPVDLSKVNT